MPGTPSKARLRLVADQRVVRARLARRETTIWRVARGYGLSPSTVATVCGPVRARARSPARQDELLATLVAWRLAVEAARPAKVAVAVCGGCAWEADRWPGRCPKCGATITPDQVKRLDFDLMECPQCGERFPP